MEKMTFKKYGNKRIFHAEGYVQTTIDEVIKFFVDAKESGSTHVNWTATVDFDGDSDDCIAHPYCNEQETDEEYKSRLKLNGYVLKRELDRAKDEYERLLKLSEINQALPPC